MSKFWAKSNESESFDESVDWDDDGPTEKTVEAEENDEVCPRTPDQSKHRIAQDPDEAWKQIREHQKFEKIPRVEARKKRGAGGCTRIVCMSDTHGQHRSICPPPGHVLIHGGDFSKTGEPGTIKDLGEYFGQLDFQQIIVIAGNHDLTFHPEHYKEAWKRFHQTEPFDCRTTQSLLTNCTYLQDSSCTLQSGEKVYGSPWQPFFYNWAFNLNRGIELREKWSRITDDTDILVTHGPPLGRGDTCAHGAVVGCFDLMEEVQDRVKPRLHVFGHVHEGYGTYFDGTTLYVNASNLTYTYIALNHCIVVDLPLDKSKPAMVVTPECKIKTVPDLLKWFKEKGFQDLHMAMKTVDDTFHIPLGDDLLKESAFSSLSDALGLTRQRSKRNDIVKALSMIYAESFEF